MTFADLDFASILLRTAVYVATVAMAGGIFFYATVRGAERVARTIRRQIWLGAALLLLIEPLRYLHFQLAIGGGAWDVAFDPAMRWMAFETPIGQAALVRIAAALAIAIAGLRRWPFATVAAAAMIASFALEGHTASHEGDRWLAAALVVTHLAMVHWWLGSLVPLWAATRSFANSELADFVNRFGQLAIAAVVVLTGTGLLLMAVLGGWQVDLMRNHQWAFAGKLTIFAVILTIAAVNKLRWTPMLLSAPDAGRAGLCRSLNWEIVFCGMVLFATAVMTSFPPTPE